MTLIRVFLDIVILVAIASGWWFLALPLAVVGLWYFPHFYEAIAAGIIYDSLFGLNSLGIVGFAGTTVGIVVTLAVILVRRMVR